MINFATFQAITIPEGKVAKITRKSDGAALWSAGRLPSEYQEVEYIYIPDTGYINTEWVPEEGSKFNIKLCALKNGYFFGCGSNPRLAYTGGDYDITIYNTTNGTSGIYRFEKSRLKILDVETYSTGKTTDSYVIVNGQKLMNNTAQGVNFNTAIPMYLGAWLYNATSIRQGAINLYYAKASVNGTPKFEMIPCYRKSDGVIGMYDLVNKKFFTNAGTGSFTKGADV